MARLIFENLSMEQAKYLAYWYGEQGEQDVDVWFDILRSDEEKEIETPYVNVTRKGGYMETDEKNETVTVYCK